jgi:dihydroflavonol-4-reductase
MILVTGATGFIGSKLVKSLVARGERVRILRRASSREDLLGPVSSRVEHVVGDITNRDAVREAVRGVRRIYHAAAFIGFEGRKDEARLFEINVGGTASIVDAALAEGVERLVHTSSMAAFGRPERTDQVLDEQMVWQPSRNNTNYARSKHLSELEVYRGVAEGLDAVMVNPALVFGPGRHDDNTMRIVEQIQRRKVPGYPSGGTCVVDVDDVVEGHLLAMERGRTGERYFLGGENLLWREIFETLAAALGVAPPARHIPRRPAMVVAVASEFVSRFTGMKPLITVETVRATAHAYRYSNRKAVEELGCSFRPFRETAERIARSMNARARAV